MGSTPYDWDAVQGCVVLNTKTWRKLSFSFAVIHSIFYMAFLIWRLGVLATDHKPSYYAIVWQWNWINMHTWALVTFYNAHKKKEDVVPLFRGLKKLVSILSRGE